MAGFGAPISGRFCAPDDTLAWADSNGLIFLSRFERIRYRWRRVSPYRKPCTGCNRWKNRDAERDWHPFRDERALGLGESGIILADSRRLCTGLCTFRRLLGKKEGTHDSVSPFSSSSSGGLLRPMPTNYFLSPTFWPAFGASSVLDVLPGSRVVLAYSDPARSIIGQQFRDSAGRMSSNLVTPR